MSVHCWVVAYIFVLVKSFAAARGGSEALCVLEILEIGLANSFQMSTRIKSGLKTLNWLYLQGTEDYLRMKFAKYFFWVALLSFPLAS